MTPAMFRKKRVFALLAVGFVLILFYRSDWIGKWLYPVKYEEEICKSAMEHGVDPVFVAAVIRVESNFRPTLISHKNAHGLMQIMPETAGWIIEQAGFSADFRQRLLEEDVNIKLGTWYIASLHRQFAGVTEGWPEKDRLALIAAAYNAGPGNVANWLASGVWDGTLDHASKVPFGETRHYIQRVLYYYEKYEDIYAKEWRSEPQKER
jgi:soluble lytic murein transglycosylase